MFMSYLILHYDPSSYLMCNFRRKLNKKDWLCMLFSVVASILSEDSHDFLKETDDFYQPFYQRNFETKNILLNASKSMHDPKIDFGTESYPMISDSGASSTATPFESNFIEGTRKKLAGVKILGIASGLTESGAGFTLQKI